MFELFIEKYRRIKFTEQDNDKNVIFIKRYIKQFRVLPKRIKVSVVILLVISILKMISSSSDWKVDNIIPELPIDFPTR
jgi:hypothetical protein